MPVSDTRGELDEPTATILWLLGLQGKRRRFCEEVCASAA